MSDKCDIDHIDEFAIKSVKSNIIADSTILSLSEKFKLLSNPTRLKILLALSHHDLCICDLAAVLETSQSAVSHQLRVLRHANFVKYNKEGKIVYYSLIEQDFISNILSKIKESRDYVVEAV